jgi:tight adherence protein B
MLRRSSAVKNFHRKLTRAFPNVLLGRFVFLVAMLAGAAFVAGTVGMKSIVIGIGLAAAACVIPFVVVSMRVAKHQKTVEDQLPEALDFLSRVLRAGHSLATGLQMAADELPHPLAGEFRRCYDQHSLGHPLEVAMRDMANRVGTADFSFFVTAVLIQRTTGGDLAEVLTNIGNMVRARIRLQQHVKAITAEGRLVGYILLVLPILFFFILYFLNPRYAGVLLDYKKYPEGVYVLCSAVFLQILGLITIKRIVAVKM